MKDIEKMKRDFEQSLKCAELENWLEEEIGCTFSVYYWNGCTHANARGITIQQAAKFLRRYPATKDMPLDSSSVNLDGTIRYKYKVSATRRFNDEYTTMRVEWYNSEAHNYSFEMKVDGTKLERYFNDSTRQMSSCEQSTYKPTKHGKLVYDVTLPIKRFRGEHIEYQGGEQSLVDINEIEKIIIYLKVRF